MTIRTLSFVGGGHMAQALIGGLINSGIDPATLHVIDPSSDAREAIQRRWGVRTSVPAEETIEHCDGLILAVKPQVMDSALVEWAGRLPDGAKPLIISVAAGVTLGHLTAVLGPRPIVRVMPNTPALLGVGMSALVANDRVDNDDRVWAQTLFDSVGETVWVDDERTLDWVTALSGSGPAYFFSLAEHMVNAAIDQGLDADLARELVHQTAYGAGCMLKDTTASAADLRARVTSPGGTTEAALNVLSEGHFNQLVKQALQAAHRRSEALGHSSHDETT